MVIREDSALLVGPNYCVRKDSMPLSMTAMCRERVFLYPWDEL